MNLQETQRAMSWRRIANDAMNYLEYRKIHHNTNYQLAFARDPPLESQNSCYEETGFEMY
jgi:hypothetical protein